MTIIIGLQKYHKIAVKPSKSGQIEDYRKKEGLAPRFRISAISRT